MTNGPIIATPSMPSSLSLIAALTGVAVISGLLVVLTYQVTLPRIAENQRVALEKAIFTVLPSATVRSNLLVEADTLTVLPPEEIEAANVFAGYTDMGALVGFALNGEARGYQDVVRILYGYAPDRECVIGMTVLQSSETPGLGDKVENDPDFLANFNCLEARLNAEGTSMRHEIVTVQHGKKTEPWQIDGISGATVTSTAIGRALRNSTREMLPALVSQVHRLEGRP